MDYLLIHYHQKDYVVLGCVFPETPNKIYFYKAEASDKWMVGDKAVVNVINKGLAFVEVRQVHTNPMVVLEGARLYRWVVQKVDMSRMAGRESMQEKMVEHLRNAEAQAQTIKTVEHHKQMLAMLPNADELARAFEQLGGPMVEVHL